MIAPGTTIRHMFSVDEKVYEGFKSIFKDENPLHTNATFAVSKGFKERVMHGNILNGFLSYLVGELLPMKNVIIQSQTIQFVKPVYLNDKVTLEATVVDYYESVASAELKYKFINQQEQVIAKGVIQIGII